MDLLNPYYLQVGTQVMIASLLGLSIYVTLSAGLLSVGAAGFMSIGAYTAALLSLRLGWPPVLTVAAGAAAGTLAGFLLGLPTLRLRGIYLAIATLGFGEMVRVTFLNLRITNGALGLAGIPNLANLLAAALFPGDSRGVLGLTPYQVGSLATLLLAALVLAGAVSLVLRQEGSRVGRALAALRQDELAAEVAGIDTRRLKMLAFLEGAGLAGLAGALSAHVSNFIGPGDFGYTRAVDVLLYAVLGGSGVVWGPLVGATALTVLPEALRFMKDQRLLVFGALLVLMMAFRPQGLVDRELLRALGALARGARRRPPATGRGEGVAA